MASIPRAVDDFVCALMAGRASKRPASAAIVAKRIDQLLSLPHWHQGDSPRRILELGLVVGVGMGIVSGAFLYLRNIGYF